MNISKGFVNAFNMFLKFFNAIFLWGIVFAICCCFYTKQMWGSVSLPQLLFFVQLSLSEGGKVEQKIIFEVIGYCLLLPSVVTCILFYCARKYQKPGVLFFNRFFFAVYLFCLWVVINFFEELSLDKQCVLYAILLVFYFINAWRNFTPLSMTVNLFLLLPVVFFIICLNGCERLFLSVFNFQETDFYAQEYTYMDRQIIPEDKKRNVIIVFGESLEKQFLYFEDNQNKLQINDENAVKFADFTEGYAQRWTQGALFSAFTGVHIHYLSDYFRYALFDKLKYNERKDRILTISNYAGEDFGFQTPNIRYLGDIMAENGYQNLFVQGGDTLFSGTAKFLYEHGFENENVYDLKDFKNTPEYRQSRHWWGVDDKNVFDLFKKKITSLDKQKPFFAVMFTLDLHCGENPFYKNDEEVKKATIHNINDFISWFEKQDFYQNTTLIVLADHKRMGKDVVAGGGLYNAFFNLPDNLINDVNLNRSFNQIDIFPTVLEIAGFELPEHKAGLGVSLFDKRKTLAERFDYDEQEKTCSKIDLFYQKLWSAKKLFPSPFVNGLNFLKVPLREKLIAHAVGALDGKVYLNSLEALKTSANRGYKYIELDLLKTVDNQIVAAHDWFYLRKCAGMHEDWSTKNLKDILDGYIPDGTNTLLTNENIVSFFLNHPDIYLVTDKFDDFSLLAKLLAPIKHRVIVEVFSPEKYDQARQEGFSYVAYNVREKTDFNLVKDQGYRLITMNLEFAREHEDDVKKLRQTGVQTMLYSVKKVEDVRKNSDIGDVFYYDGEENLI